MISVEVILGATVFILGNIALSFATITYASYLFENKQRRKDDFELVKNGLFTFALSILYADYIDKHNYYYDEYDGTTLPPPSGSDAVNACLSYMVDSNNPHIHSKYNAIQRFLHVNLQTEAAQEQFMEEFIEIFTRINEIASLYSEEEQQIINEEPEVSINKDKEE